MKKDNSLGLNFTRGEFFRLAAGAGAALALGTDAGAAGPQLMRTIPSSGEKIPAVGLGTAHTFNVERDASLVNPRREVVRLFFREGGKVIDTSPSYGASEALAGDLVRDAGAGDRAFVATKISTWGGREAGVEQVNESMKRFRRKKIDLEQVHNLKDTAIHLKTLRKLKDAGRVRYIGVTNHRPSSFGDIAALIKKEPIDFVQIQYNIQVRVAEKMLLPLCADKGVAVMVNLPYARARLFRAVKGKGKPEWLKEFGADSWGQFFLKYILSNPAVTVIIPATRKPKHLLDNMGAGRGPLPDAAGRAKMLKHWKQITA
ncbi:MAG: aldo/keto reductase [Nitrospinaceae bacterium]|jgi:aryl-alcohol dehydrogenase-like predicted oxidoreductase|nr:aldo/keto reductase [Nitrospinaceae bacterium]MBT3435380.1 aldo/keto reductase [Nitrospinaceae bacterium]MBT3821397.1 aldo/keto reductase [Nitrospinaceae bacterium]MBT4094335.1 aldo/keto reductase [Nitrospinaceae bacterium]MBT4429134.1 aldo/keto reductase [Nitrospinaceae bacterium]